MNIKMENVITLGKEVYKVGDVVKVVKYDFGRKDVYIGRIISINQDCFCIDYSKEYKARLKSIYFCDIEELQNMEWGDK